MRNFKRLRIYPNELEGEALNRLVKKGGKGVERGKEEQGEGGVRGERSLEVTRQLSYSKVNKSSI